MKWNCNIFLYNQLSFLFRFIYQRSFEELFKLIGKLFLKCYKLEICDWYSKVFGIKEWFYFFLDNIYDESLSKLKIVKFWKVVFLVSRFYLSFFIG